jgi:hypothetical protein
MTAIYFGVIVSHETVWSARRQTYCSHNDEQRLEDLRILGEQVQPQVDEDEILR